MMKLNNTYNRDDFLQFLGEDFLTDFKKDVRPTSTQGLSSIQKVYSLGRSESLDLQVFEFSFEGSPNKRVALTKDAFQIMRSYAIFQALAIFHSPGSDDWRLSLMTATPERTEKGKVALLYSNPKRLSFFLGPNAKVNTPTKFLLKKGTISDFDDLKSRFSIEVVNKEFYQEISELFTQLVGGSVFKGQKRVDYEPLLKLPSLEDRSQTSLEFAVRLIGRFIFCWFLREKKSDQGRSLMPNDLLSLVAVNKNPDYYHKVLEPIFFEVLNKPGRSRKDEFAKEPFSSVPYLNGGLFSPHDDDFFSYNEGIQAANRNTVIIPDEWLRKFFAVLETYNFTIDENISFDEELSIDPEMLGRIFENLLAEINPETGESVRKSTGSYYTPRVIVDYMVDESLLLYLKQQTQIQEEKLRAVLSYDLQDDEESPLSEHESERVISALEKVKILDPACGSGAFPIGALQKIVFILQQADPEGHLWFKQQIKNTPPELRRVVEREFAHKNFDYIRKLGIIRENIYGIDIQPIATEIARLRCFLTLVVDERIQEDLENRGIEPLPNLDFKFVTTNSLIGLPGSQKNSQIGLFEDESGIRELKELRDMFFTASGAERDQLKLQFVQAQNRMFQRLISEGIRGHADLTTKLSTWDPFSHKSSSWFDPEWMFGVKDGFDIVIANPPYIFARNSVQKGLTKEDKKYFYENYRLAQYQVNLYALFIELATKLLKVGGCLSFITPNNWLTINTNSSLRQFILEKSDISIVNFYARVFESASVDSAVVIFRNTRQHPLVHLFEYINGFTFIKSERSDFFLKQKDMIINIETLKDSKVAGLLNKIESSSCELKELSNVKAGLKAYEVGKGVPPQTKAMKDNRIYHSKEKLEKDYYKYLDGKDVCRYYLIWSGEFLKYGDNLAARRKDFTLFSSDRILVRQIPAKPPYCIHACPVKEIYLNDLNSMNVINLKETPELLLGIINSRLMSFWFMHKFGKLQRGTFPQFKVNELEMFPIARNRDDYRKPISELVKQMIAVKSHDLDSVVQDLDHQIDRLVYKLYGLTEEEVEMVEGQASVKIDTEPILETAPRKSLPNSLSSPK